MIAHDLFGCYIYMYHFSVENMKYMYLVWIFQQYLQIGIPDPVHNFVPYFIGSL